MVSKSGGKWIYRVGSQSRKYRLPPEHALALANESSPIYLQGIFKAIKSYFKDEEEFLKMFRGERTLSWMDHNHFMEEGFAEFFNRVTLVT